MTIITRTNGQPFATEASARQQLTAKGLQGTHEVVPHEGGYALAPKQDVPNHKFKVGDKATVVSNSFDTHEFEAGETVEIKNPDTVNRGRNACICVSTDGARRQWWVDQDNLVPVGEDAITLRGGDHVSTEGMTEDQYHAVARAFMEAGADGSKGDFYHLKHDVSYLGWDKRDDELWDCGHLAAGFNGRHLIIAQVMAATNANPQPEAQPGPTTTQTPITTLLAARKARDEAEAAYQAALEVARNELPGYVLTEVGNDAQQVDGEDMAYPANWREGDVLIAERDRVDIREGSFYSLRADSDGDLGIIDDAGDWRHSFCGLRFHHRPA